MKTCTTLFTLGLVFVVRVEAAYAQSFSPAIEGVALVEIWTTATGQSEQVGSGVAIDLDGDILTAKHVLKGFNEANQSIYVRFNARSGNPIPVLSHNCARGDPDKDGADICVLKIGETDLKNTARVLSVQPMMCRKLVRDEKITGSGWPGQSDYSWEPIDGHITQSDTLKGYPTTSQALPGMSGGPFYDEKGEIVGLIKGGVENDTRTLLAPLFSARDLIDNTGTSCAVPSDVALRPPHEVSREITWGTEVGGSGGDPFKISCGAGEALAGLYGKKGGSDDVRVFSVGPLCVSALVPSSQHTEWTGTPYSGDYVGAYQGDDFEIRCPAQMVVIGLNLQSTGFSNGQTYLVKPLSLKCSRELKISAATPISETGGAIESVSFATHKASNCADGSVGTAIGGRAGQWVDALQIGCSQL